MIPANIPISISIAFFGNIEIAMIEVIKINMTDPIIVLIILRPPSFLRSPIFGSTGSWIKI